MIVLIIDDETQVLSSLLRVLSRVPGVVPEPCLVRDEAELTRALDRITSLVGNRDPFALLCDYEMGTVSGAQVRQHFYDIVDVIADHDTDMDQARERARFSYHTGAGWVLRKHGGIPKGDLEQIQDFVERNRKR